MGVSIRVTRSYSSCLFYTLTGIILQSFAIHTSWLQITLEQLQYIILVVFLSLYSKGANTYF